MRLFCIIMSFQLCNSVDVWIKSFLCKMALLRTLHILWNSCWGAISEIHESSAVISLLSEECCVPCSNCQFRGIKSSILNITPEILHFRCGTCCLSLSTCCTQRWTACWTYFAPVSRQFWTVINGSYAICHRKTFETDLSLLMWYVESCK